MSCWRGFPLGLDPASLRVEGEGSARNQTRPIDARQPVPRPVVGRARAREEIAGAGRRTAKALGDRIAAATARKDFARRFVALLGLGEGEQRPAAVGVA